MYGSDTEVLPETIQKTSSRAAAISERTNPPVCPVSELLESKVPQNQLTFPRLYKIVYLSAAAKWHLTYTCVFLGSTPGGLQLKTLQIRWSAKRASAAMQKVWLLRAFVLLPSWNSVCSSTIPRLRQIFPFLPLEGNCTMLVSVLPV